MSQTSGSTGRRILVPVNGSDLDEEMVRLAATTAQRISAQLIIVYVMGNAGAFWYYLRQKRGEFNPLLHFLIPLGSSVALGWVFYENVASLHPFDPNTYFDYSPLMVIIWTAVGIGVLVVMHLRGKEDWLFKAGEAAHERPETAEEAAHRPAL